MLKALTNRERRLLVAILAMLLIGSLVKWWRWREGQNALPDEAPAAKGEQAAWYCDFSTLAA